MAAPLSSAKCQLQTHFKGRCDDNVTELRYCTKPIQSHMRKCRVSRDVAFEGELLARRAGIFGPVSAFGNMTVCDRHRNSNGISWTPARKCSYFEHSSTSKAKPQFGMRQYMSLKLMTEYGVFIPVGSGICKSCHMKLLEKYGSDETVCSSKVMQSKVDTCASIELQTEECSVKQGDFETADSDMIYDDSQSTIQFSQPSNWSEDFETDRLGHVNKVLGLASGGKCSPLRGQLQTEISQCKASTVRYYKRKAVEAVDSVLELIAPGQAQELKKTLTTSQSSSKCPTESELTSSIIKLYSDTTDSRLRTQILSVLAEKMTKQDIIKNIPNVTKYQIDKARINGKENLGIAVAEKTKLFRHKMNQEKLQHALNFFFDPSFIQIVSYGTKDMIMDCGESLIIPDVVRTSCHSHMIKMYEAYCSENDFQPLGKTTLFQILRSCKASQRKNLHGLDNIAADGVEGFNELDKTVDKLYEMDMLSLSDHKELKNMISGSKIYIKTDYKLHIKQSDLCADHCIEYSLSDPADPSLQTECQHNHTLKCDRCEVLKEIDTRLKSVLNDIHDRDVYVEIEKRLSDASCKILNWKSHIMRTVNQDRFKLEKLESLENNELMIVMDWAMKFLPLKYRETQTDWFGQRGLSWHVTVCVFKDASNNLCHRTFTHVMESVKQDWYCVMSILEDILENVKIQLPHINEVVLRSDNAGCYHCGQIWLSLPELSERTGIRITKYCYSEPQAGKSYCDSKIAHMRTKMKTYVAGGKNIVSPSDMKMAIDSGSGVAGCQVSVINVESTNQTFKRHKLKDVSKFNEVHFSNEGFILRKAFSIGKGHFISKQQILNLSYNQATHHRSGCTTIEPFSVPSISEGKIKRPNCSTTINSNEYFSENINEHTDRIDSEIFHCPETGCKKKYASFRGLENHIILGKHEFQMQRKSTYDLIKEQWASLCSDVIITCKNVSSTRTVENDLNVMPMGWALKKSKVMKTFSEKVKAFLYDKFNSGNRSGKRCNPCEVAEEMKTLKDKDGKKVFTTDEWLTVSQITSYFSRLSAKMPESSKVVKEEEINDEDLTAVLNSIEENSLIKQLSEN